METNNNLTKELKEVDNTLQFTENSDKRPNPNFPHWTMGQAFLLWGFSVFLVFFLGVGTVAIYAWANNLPLSAVAIKNADTELDSVRKTAIILNILAMIPAHILTFLAVWMVVTKNGRLPFFASFGWKFTKEFGLLASVSFGLVMFLLGGLIVSQIGDPENDLTRILKSSREATYITAVLASFTAPIVEEIVYRGVLFSAFYKYLGTARAVILVTTLFALVHVPQYYPSVGVILVICFLSFFLTIIRAWTGKLLPCIVIHFVFNGIQSILLIMEPYIEKLVEQQKAEQSFIFRMLNL
jgi:membrane protease YdiL (CAAX protease family)